MPDDHQVRISHLIDDHELVRTSALRTLTAQVEMLSLGLHALRNGSPEVTDEYLDRAITALTAEITHLKES